MKFAVLGMFFLLSFATSLVAQEVTKPGAEHAFLAEAEGEWTVTMASPGGELTGKSSNKMAHGGLWLTSQVEMKMPEGPFSGTGLDSYDPIKKKFVAIWVDSMSAMPLILEGDRSPDGKKITMTGKGPSPDGTSTNYKTETEYVSKDKHVFKMWMGTTSGEPMMVATYVRKK
jgi:Protein of unknown function (DUF1579)